MKFIKSMLIILSSVSLLFLTACNNSNQATNPENNTTNATPASSTAPANETAKTESSSQNAQSKKGGQVVESGAYHLEFVPEKSDQGTHMDLFLLKGDNHETVSNAKVTAQVQLPDGTQKSLNLTYDAEGKHYTVLLPEKAVGQYQVKMIAEVDSKKVDGRFSFNK
jgi:major membrane immunogen (membrane-anchored lipoprotein)